MSKTKACRKSCDNPGLELKHIPEISYIFLVSILTKCFFPCCLLLVAEKHLLNPGLNFLFCNTNTFPFSRAQSREVPAESNLCLQSGRLNNPAQFPFSCELPSPCSPLCTKVGTHPSREAQEAEPTYDWIPEEVLPMSCEMASIAHCLCSCC